ncbi:MAG TPA: cell division protein FtsL [Arenimonas sp.]|nr:cell division protein FtsL [Arenimonas sp.]
MSARLFILMTLLIATLSSAIAVVFARHVHRQAYVELTKLQRQRDEFNVEFRRLQTEQATVSESNRIVGIATEKLGMHFPLDTETMVVQP